MVIKEKNKKNGERKMRKNRMRREKEEGKIERRKK